MSNEYFAFQYEEPNYAENFPLNSGDDWFNCLSEFGNMKDFPSFDNYDHDEHLRRKFTHVLGQEFNLEEMEAFR